MTGVGLVDGKPRETPCVGEAMLLKIQRESPSRYCPRVELPEEHETLATLALIGYRVGLDSPAFGLFFESYTAELGVENQRSILEEIAMMLGNELVVAKSAADRERRFGGK